MAVHVRGQQPNYFLMGLGAFALCLTSCSGPAGVAPQVDRTVEIRSCSITEDTFKISDSILVDASRCPQLEFTGKPLVIGEEKSLTVRNAGDLVVEGSLQILGRFSGDAAGKQVHFRGPTPTETSSSTYEIAVFGEFSGSGIGFSGPGTVVFGSDMRAPKAVKISDATLSANEFGSPSLTLFGHSRDCDESPSVSAYTFSNVRITSLADQTIRFLHMPEELAGLEFSPEAPDQSFKAALGAVCVGKSQILRLNNPHLTYQAESARVSGSLILTGTNLIITGSEPVTVDGGTLISEGSDHGQNTLTFSGSAPLQNKRIITQNGASLVLRKTVLKDGSITASGSKVTLDQTKIESPCATSPNDADCQSTEQKAALTLKDSATADLNKTELEPKTETQIFVADEDGTKSQVITTGDPGDYKVSSQTGSRFFLSRRLYITRNVPIDKKIADELLNLNGTYEGPCLTSEGEEKNTFRRIFTFDNAIGSSLNQVTNVQIYTPTKLRVVRTIINYDDGACQRPAYTSHLGGDTTYFIRHDDDGTLKTDTLLNEVYYDFNQMIWTYHNPNIINSFNEEKICGIDNWQVDVPQDITFKICYGTKIYFKGFFDRFDRFDGRNLHLGLDYDDRPDDLADLIPFDVNRRIDFIKKD